MPPVAPSSSVGRRKARTVHEAALQLLARKSLSERELAERLARWGFSPDDIEEEVIRLRRTGLVSDLEVARMAARSQLVSGHGVRAVRAHLKRREVDPEACERALAELAPEEEQAALAKALERALRRYETADPSLRRQKVVRYLLGRGFGLAAALRATEFLGGELDEEALDEPGDPEDLS